MCASKTPPPVAARKPGPYRSQSVHVVNSIDDRPFKHTPRSSTPDRSMRFSNGIYHAPPPLPERIGTRGSATPKPSGTYIHIYTYSILQYIGLR